MATATRIARVQIYPRIETEKDRYEGFLDDLQLTEHHSKRISDAELKLVIRNGIRYASAKSSRQVLSIPDSISDDELQEFYKKKGKALFNYFVKYCGDPPVTAFECQGKLYSEIAMESFQNNSMQKERMNSGWRYQYIAKELAKRCGRFESVSDLNLKEADFMAEIKVRNSDKKVNIYTSVKNRSNTMGGQDWPKAIAALEAAAVHDKNRDGAFICVFGIAMEKGTRVIRMQKESGRPYSSNTEIWFSDYFWKFFTNFSYGEIASAVYEVVSNEPASRLTVLPPSVIESFGDCCRSKNLVDSGGSFNDPKLLIDLFCGIK